MAIEMGADEFEGYVNDALDTIPDELFGLLDNCIIVIEDDAPPDDPDLLGLYDGIPLTERGMDYSGYLPDTIHIFRRNILAACDTETDVVKHLNLQEGSSGTAGVGIARPCRLALPRAKAQATLASIR